jgi:hypothetical protein
MASKYGQIITVVLMGALTLGSISVMGLLQSTERVSTAGIIVKPFKDTIFIPFAADKTPNPPPPEPSIEIDVYSDPECTTIMSDVPWGEIESGESSNHLVYVKNNGDTSVVLSLSTENWSSSTAQNNMFLTWDYDGSQIQPNVVKAVTLNLNVDSDCPELSSFGFDIIIIGS